MNNFSPDRTSSNFSLIYLLNILFKHKRIILSILIPIIVIGILFSFLMPPIYRASSKLLVEKEIEYEKALLFRMNIPTSYQELNLINTELEIIQSPPVAMRVIEDLGLN